MKDFVLESSMLSMGGVFYPTGYMFIMFPEEADALKAQRDLEADGYSGEAITVLSPSTILEKVVRTVGSADIPLPSAGTEGATVRRYAELASQGQWALMIHAPETEDTERVMNVVRNVPFTYGQKYRTLIIEDME